MIAGNIAALYDQLQNIYHCLKGKIIWGFGLITEDMCKCLLGIIFLALISLQPCQKMDYLRSRKCNVRNIKNSNKLCT